MVKEQGRGITTTIRYYLLPVQITIQSVYFVIMWLNGILDRNEISENYSQKEIVTGRHLDLKNNCKVVFVSYEESHGDPKVTNNTRPITHEYIFLGPNINLQGNQKILCINSGRLLKIENIIPMVEPYRVIIKMNYLCMKSKIEKYRRKMEFLNNIK